MATPMASGLAALILERQPSATPGQVKRGLVAAARDMRQPPNVQGHGEVDGFRAVIGYEPVFSLARPGHESELRRPEVLGAAATR